MIASARGVPDLMTVLAAAAAEPALDGVLMLDLPAGMLPSVITDFAALLAHRYGGRRPRAVMLGSWLQDDDLWTSLSVSREPGGSRFMPAPGPLVEAPGEPPLLLVIPDLPRASLAVARAATMLVGAAVGHVERHGISQRWVPRATWLACCASAEAGMVSAHLMDRFQLRFPAGRSVPAPDPVIRIADALAARGDNPSPRAVPRRWREVIGDQRAGRQAQDAALTRAVELHGVQAPLRRPLALARLAAGLARLDGAQAVTAEHVEDAAILTGLIDPTLGQPSVAGPDAPQAPDEPDEPLARPAGVPEMTGTGESRSARPGAVTDAGEPQALGPAPAPDVATAPYPEDTAEPAREAAPLRLPWERRRGRPVLTGQAVGVRPAEDLSDIAWVPTAMEAARHRRRRPRADGRLALRPGDLRAYRRAPESEYLLALLLDHTCRGEWDWTESLGPFLRWGYVRRAAVCVVEVGSAEAPSSLRAERLTARSILDPRVATSLARRAGSATPLAHGLTSVLGAIRHAMQHGRARITETLLVVVTDGLGNVPLSASLDDRVTGLITDEGVTDALRCAAELAELDTVRRVCVAPPKRAYPTILSRLGQALAATVVSGDSAPAEEAARGTGTGP